MTSSISSKKVIIFAALETALRAMTDWTRTYASEFCDPEHVEETMRRMEGMGTIGYIDHVATQLRNALSLMSTDEPSVHETSCELERLRELQEKALALDDAVAEFGIDKPQYIAEAYQAFHDVLHDGHGSPSVVKTLVEVRAFGTSIDPPSQKATASYPDVCGKPMPAGKGARTCINVRNHEGPCDDMPF